MRALILARRPVSSPPVTVDDSGVVVQVDCDERSTCTLDTCNPLLGICEHETDPAYLEGPFLWQIDMFNGCITIGPTDGTANNGTTVFRVYTWPGVSGSNPPAGWTPVNNCTQSAFRPNALGYWPSLRQKDCPAP